MKLLLIRHGDPNYDIDSLTEKGWKEAALLAERMAKLKIRTFYVSPLGRAKDTASLTLQKMGRDAIELPWLREFHAPIPDFHTGVPRIPWDQLPQDWGRLSRSITIVCSGAKRCPCCKVTYRRRQSVSGTASTAFLPTTAMSVRETPTVSLHPTRTPSPSSATLVSPA